jgi:hypothetical protein
MSGTFVTRPENRNCEVFAKQNRDLSEVCVGGHTENDGTLVIL